MPEGWFTGEAGSSGGGPPVFDAAGSGGTAGFTTALNWNHTVGSGANRMIMAAIGFAGGFFSGSCGFTGSDSISHAMTHLTDVFDPGGGLVIRVYYLLAPVAGLGSVGFSTSTGVKMAGASLSFTNADQVTPFGTSGSFGSAGSATASTTITATTNHVVVSVVDFYDNSPITVTAGSGQTVQAYAVGGAQAHVMATTQAGATSVTSSFTSTAVDDCAQFSVPVHGATASVFQGWA